MVYYNHPKLLFKLGDIVQCVYYLDRSIKEGKPYKIIHRWYFDHPKYFNDNYILEPMFEVEKEYTLATIGSNIELFNQ